MMSYEAYIAAVKKEFRKMWPSLSDEEVEAFFEQEMEKDIKGIHTQKEKDLAPKNGAWGCCASPSELRNNA